MSIQDTKTEDSLHVSADFRPSGRSTNLQIPAMKAPAEHLPIHTGPAPGRWDRRFLRESLGSLMFRRVTFAWYRRTERFRRHLVVARQRGLEGHILPVPLIADVLAVYLSGRLPDRLIAKWGHEGLLRYAIAITETVKSAARFCKSTLTLLIETCRRFKDSTRQLLSNRTEKHLRSGLFLRRSFGDMLHVLLDGRILIESSTLTTGSLILCMRRVRPVDESVQIFVHAYPEDPSLLPHDRRSYGFFCKDHNPGIQPSEWPRHLVYRDETNLIDLPPGFYRIVVGIIDRKSFYKFVVSGETRDSIDLGWTRLGSSGEAAR